MSYPSIITHIKGNAHRHPFLYVFFVVGILCLIAAAILSLSTVQRIHRRPLPRPSQTDVSLIQDWMTLPYISKVYGVPEPYLLDQLKITPADSKGKNLKALAASLNESSETLVQKVQSSVTQFQQSRKPEPKDVLPPLP